jgi:hypothetical protein
VGRKREIGIQSRQRQEARPKRTHRWQPAPLPVDCVAPQQCLERSAEAGHVLHQLRASRFQSLDGAPQRLQKKVCLPPPRTKTTTTTTTTAGRFKLWVAQTKARFDFIQFLSTICMVVRSYDRYVESLGWVCSSRVYHTIRLPHNMSYLVWSGQKD